MGKLAGTFTPSRHRKALDDASNVAEPLADFINGISDAVSDNKSAIQKETSQDIIKNVDSINTVYLLGPEYGGLTGELTLRMPAT